MNRKKMIMYVLLSMLALSMGGLSASAAATAGKTAAVDKAIESIMKTKFVPVYYERKTIGKMKSVSQEKADPQKKTDPQTEETVVKTWDNTAKGQYREEAKSAGKTYYVVSDEKKNHSLYRRRKTSHCLSFSGKLESDRRQTRDQGYAGYDRSYAGRRREYVIKNRLSFQRRRQDSQEKTSWRRDTHRYLSRYGNLVGQKNGTFTKVKTSGSIL